MSILIVFAVWLVIAHLAVISEITDKLIDIGERASKKTFLGRSVAAAAIFIASVIGAPLVLIFMTALLMQYVWAKHIAWRALEDRTKPKDECFENFGVFVLRALDDGKGGKRP